MKFINDNIEINEIKEKVLKNKIEKLKKQINEKEDEKSNLINYIDKDILKQNTKEDDERKSLLNTSIGELKELSDINQDYIDLINCIAQDKIIKARIKAEKLKNNNL